MTRLILAVPVWLATCAAIARPVGAADTASDREQAKAHFRAGKAHTDARRYEAAIAEFEKGYALEPLPGFLFNAGSVARMAKQPERALRYLERYLAVTMDEPENAERRDARAWIAELRRQLPVAAPVVSPPVAQPEPAIVAPTTPAATNLASDDDARSARRRSRRRLAIGLGVVGGLVVIGGVAAAIAVPLSSGPSGPPPGTSDWGTLAINPR